MNMGRVNDLNKTKRKIKTNNRTSWWDSKIGYPVIVTGFINWRGCSKDGL